jgi:hypothetical protein
VAGDAASFDLDCTLPVAFLSGVFDHFLDDGERLAALANIACHLIPGGLLVFDVFLGLMRGSPLMPIDSVRVGNREYHRAVGTRLLPGRKMETTLVFETYVDGKLEERIEEWSLVGLTNRDEVHRLLVESGFSVSREFADYGFTPYHRDNPLLVVEALRGEQWTPTICIPEK